MTQVKNYMFACDPPVVNAKRVNDQMYKAFVYRNKLVEIELKRREAANTLIRRLSPDYAAAEDAERDIERQLAKLRDEVKAGNAAARKKLALSDTAADQIAALEEQLRDVRVTVKKTKAAAFAMLKELQQPLWAKAEAVELPPKLSTQKRKQAIRLEFHRLCKEAQLDDGQGNSEAAKLKARADSGLFWGTYGIIEDACAKISQGAPPRFKPWRGDGAIAVQIQKANPVNIEKALSCTDTRLQFVIPNQEELATRGKSRGLRAKGVVRIRVGSINKRQPIWAELPVTWHRPLPANGFIKYAFIHRQRVGSHDKWFLRLTIESESTGRDIPADRKGTSVCVHVGWRLLDDKSMRIATWIGSDGREGTMALDVEHVSADAVPEGLEAVRDKVFNKRRPRFVDRLLTHVDEFPTWMSILTSDIRQWQGKQRFHKLCQQWWNERRFRAGFTQEQWLAIPPKNRLHAFTVANIEDAFPEEGMLFELLNRWRKWDKHLWDWAAFQRRRVQLRRYDLYRCFAKQLSADNHSNPPQPYEKLILAKIDWAKLLTKKTTAKHKSPLTERQRHYGRLASPGQLTSFLKERFAGDVIDINPANITLTCHYCGCVNKTLNPANRWHTCESCNKQWDIDHNACLNSLHDGLHNPESGVPLAAKQPTTKKKGRNNRRKEQMNLDV